jgi:hypothetical protein
MNQDQIAGQIRILIPVLGTMLASYGVASADVATITKFALIMAGPIGYVIAAILSYFANTRTSIMTAAAKPVAPGVPAPMIVLPHQEKALADALPANVTAAEVTQ